MKYVSTRGEAKEASFENILASGTASDGGLFVPSVIPRFERAVIDDMKNLSYTEIAEIVIKPFIGDFLQKDELQKIILDAYKNFETNDVVQIKDYEFGHVLELFHGPTLAFKDVAMQLLGRFLNAVSEKLGKKIVILGATSGDTGSAAIAACQNFENLHSFIFFPDGKISEVQRKQMTTWNKDNVEAVSVTGNFDDCQDFVKKMFADTSENKDILFASINSINWTRILAQTVYFFYLSSRIDKEEINVSIPSGNFGHAYAGWYAKKMGLNLNKINIATNRNNVLDIFFKNNIYRKLNTKESLAPSMDISSASNFERLVFDSMEGNGIETQKLMKQFKKDGFSIDNKLYKDLCNVFESHSVADEEILEEIELLYEMTGDIFDPHTAIGIKNIREGSTENYVCFATAHPSKFIDTIKKVIPNFSDTPKRLQKFLDSEEKYETMNYNFSDLKEFILNKI